MSEDITLPDLTPMYDKNGFRLQVGDSITFDGGKGRIDEYLGDAGKFGARVRVVTPTNHKVDIALLLAQAEYRRPTDPDEEAPGTPHYGV